jgi:hypothetical protein
VADNLTPNGRSRAACGPGPVPSRTAVSGHSFGVVLGGSCNHGFRVGPNGRVRIRGDATLQRRLGIGLRPAISGPQWWYVTRTDSRNPDAVPVMAWGDDSRPVVIQACGGVL